jgi:prepilin-type N-terminal cleavage/methylation domain-containing protein
MKGNPVFDNLSRIQRNRELNGERGFTLIELLIVIVVLGILAAVVVFALGGVTGQSTVAACNSDAKTVSTAVSAYEASPPSGIAAGTIPTLSQLVPNYLKSLPAVNSSYAITVDASGNVNVALGAATDPGLGSYTPAATPAGFGINVAEAYEGASAFKFPNSGTWPTSLQGAGICVGA